MNCSHIAHTSLSFHEEKMIINVNSEILLNKIYSNTPIFFIKKTLAFKTQCVFQTLKSKTGFFYYEAKKGVFYFILIILKTSFGARGFHKTLFNKQIRLFKKVSIFLQKNACIWVICCARSQKPIKFYLKHLKIE